MKIIKNPYLDHFDVGIFGLGYESRSTSAFNKHHSDIEKCITLGYESHLDSLFYPSNKKVYEKNEVATFEGSDETVLGKFKNFIDSNVINKEARVILDITVMSRHRLAVVIDTLLCSLRKGSSLTVVYSISDYVAPPKDTTPIKKVSEISSDFCGVLGDLSLPTSLVIGLGYEKNKALGLSNYIDAGSEFIFIPRSPNKKFEKMVKTNNSELLDLIPRKNIFYYDVFSPYSTYLDLRSLLISLSDHSRPLLVPLGPKILAALSVVLGREMHPLIPVWRVSSEHLELPTERPASGDEIAFTISI